MQGTCGGTRFRPETEKQEWWMCIWDHQIVKVKGLITECPLCGGKVSVEKSEDLVVAKVRTMTQVSIRNSLDWIDLEEGWT